MNGETMLFITNTYKKLYNREPNEFEKFKWQALVRNNTAVTPTTIYFALMTSDPSNYCKKLTQTQADAIQTLDQVLKFAFNEGISFVVECTGQEEIDFYWNTLTADGGNESMCGWLKDKFGVFWQIIPKNIGTLMMDPANGQKAMQALMQMKKIEIAKLINP